MNRDLLNILSGDNKDIDNQKLVEYLNGSLPPDEMHGVEEDMAASEFMNDAVEGLETIKSQAHIRAYVDQLNQELQQLVEKKKMRRDKRRIREYPWIYLTIVVVLVLCVLGYFLVRQFLHLHH